MRALHGRIETATALAILLVAALALWPGGLARAEVDLDNLRGTAVARLAPAGLPMALRPLVPGLLEDVAKERATKATAKALKDSLGNSQRPLVRAAYEKLDKPVFIAANGLSPAGEVAMRWLADGDFHGHTPAAEAHEKLAAGLDKEEPNAGEPTKWPALTIDDAALLEIWRATQGAEDRLEATKPSLEEKVQGARSAIDAYVKRAAQDGRRRADLELGIAEALTGLVVNLPQRPRPVGVHEDKRGNYLPPDTLWKDRPPNEPSQQDATALMAAAAKGAEPLTAYLEGKCPPHEQYLRLIKAARRYHSICAKGEWEKLKLPKKSVGKGQWRDAEGIRKLQARLKREELLEGEPTGELDDATVEGLTEYQRLHDLKPSGKFNKPTARSLNTSCKRRLDTIRINARRWRVSGLTDHKTYVHVNLSGAQARYVSDGQVRFEPRVIVGQGRSYWDNEKKRRVYRNATPILTDEIGNIVFNPSWTVPRRIILNEIQPAYEKDPNYLTDHGYVVTFRPDGSMGHVKQVPHEKNALGDVKFLFPNSESVYMHDTPKRGLFTYAKRDFSHGCVRVDDAVEFATVMLKDEFALRGEDPPRGFISLAKTDKTWRYKLTRKVPVLIEYYSVTVKDDGKVVFHHDFYDYDQWALVGPYGRKRPRHPEY